MSAKLLEGKPIADQIHAETAAEIKRLKERGITPNIVFVRVGEDPASVVYVNMKAKTCERLGAAHELHTLPEKTTQEELLALIDKLNHRPEVDGILVQLPVPWHINAGKVVTAIDPAKDVDCFHPQNVGKLALGESPEKCFWPCTPAGVQQLLIRGGVPIEGRHVVVVGRSNLVGKPLALILMQKAPHADATVTVCHSRTVDLAQYTRQADILVAAMGKAEIIRGDMIKPGAVVVDVGVNKIEDKNDPRGYRLVGDVQFGTARQVASLITPVPGGVGPMTIAMLLHNTVLACKLRRGN